MSAIHYAALLAAPIVSALLLGASHRPGQSPENPARGRQVYQRYCSQCHGDRGDGAGEVARWARPRPRDFSPRAFSSSAPQHRMARCQRRPTSTG